MADKHKPERKYKLPAPIANAGRELTAETAAMTPDEKTKTALERWRGVQQKVLKLASQAADDNDAGRVKNYSIAAGIATEKVLLLENKPTAIIGGLEQNRHLLPDVLEKLAAAARIVGKTNG